MRALVFFLALSSVSAWRVPSSSEAASKKPSAASPTEKLALGRREWMQGAAAAAGAVLAGAALPTGAVDSDAATLLASPAAGEMEAFDVDGDGKLNDAERKLQKLLDGDDTLSLQERTLQKVLAAKADAQEEEITVAQVAEEPAQPTQDVSKGSSMLPQISLAMAGPAAVIFGQALATAGAAAATGAAAWVQTIMSNKNRERYESTVGQELRAQGVANPAQARYFEEADASQEPDPPAGGDYLSGVQSATGADGAAMPAGLGSYLDALPGKEPIAVTPVAPAAPVQPAAVAPEATPPAAAAPAVVAPAAAAPVTSADLRLAADLS